jgi:amino acid adenylation domain-containing protein
MGIGPGHNVGIYLNRGLHVPVALLGTLKAGAAYVPLDPRYPSQRLEAMIACADLRVFVTERALAGRFVGAVTTCLLMDEEPSRNQVGPDAPVNSTFERQVGQSAGSDRLAYVIFTSGSTGRPKGVVMGRAALANLIAWQCTYSRAARGARTLQYTPLSFDVHFQEYFGTWASGGALVLVPDEVRLDPLLLLSFLQEQSIQRLFLPFIALQTLAETARARHIYPRSLSEIITAGEQLQTTADIADFFDHLPECALHNHYGPSETHVVTAYTLQGPPSSWPPLPPIGKPLPGVGIHVLQDDGQPALLGQPGELFVSGVALAHGYYGQEQLTAERFVQRDGVRMYRTGDLARLGSDGNYEYLGRSDNQVKIRGHRVELGEVELALCGHPSVRQAAVAVQEDGPANRTLTAFVVLRDGATFDAVELRRHLAAKLPEYMLPAVLTPLADLPKTPSGKVDRSALPLQHRCRPALTQEYAVPRPGLEQTLASLWQQLLHLDRVGRDDPFFELGGNSILSVQMLTRFHAATGFDVPLAKLFQEPTIASLVASIESKAKSPPPLYATARARLRQSGDPGTIAIVGMAGRFPGAKSVGELWANLCAGVESIRFFRDSELCPTVPAEMRCHPAYVRARGVVDGAESFDAAFFGISPREAEIMDPQQRLFLETAWEALEDAGCDPERFPGLIGVYAGAHNNSYFPWASAQRPDLVAKLGEFPAMLANEKDYLATRTAYALNLKGPALNINTACSTSLVAIVQAVHALLARQCDAALAGGVSVTYPQASGYIAHEGGMLSPDGHCRPFSADAGGTLFSSGVGVVVLKRLEDAQAHGDTIYALIRGAALNNDGAGKTSFTAPSVRGQAEVIAMAQAMAGVSPDAISYVEAHGTATPLGDPVEVEALTQVFRERSERVGYCRLGSIKGNLGHMVAAAGVAGLIKTALSLHREQLPPSLHCSRPTPRIAWDDSPFRLVDRLTDWPRTGLPRRAAVSSFGVGGTNAHVVLEEAPAAALPQPEKPQDELLVLSARSDAALDATAQQLAGYLAGEPGSLADVAFTLQAGRRAFTRRRFVVAKSTAEAAQYLRQSAARPVESGDASAAATGMVWLFPGQGTQYPAMGRALFRDEPVFREWFTRCTDIVRPHLGRDLREIVFVEDEKTLEQTRFTQPAIFALSYSLAKLLESWGLWPAQMVGHSVGEFAAACLAGVFSLEDGLTMVVRRAELMQAQPAGCMLSVRMPANEVLPWLGPTSAIASINAPRLCVVSGPDAEIDAVEKRCAGLNVACRRLKTSHAFHSPMMDPVLAPFAAAVREVKLLAPTVPIVSTVTGKLLSDLEATDPAYWSNHLRATVRFADALARALQTPDQALLELGPRSTLATLARQQSPPGVNRAIIATLEGSNDGQGERACLLQAVGRLWLAGIPIDWPRLHRQPRRKVSLPGYAFQRQRHVVEPRTAKALQIETLPPERTDKMPGRKERILTELYDLFEESSGQDLRTGAADRTFLELGLDSLFLTQAALHVYKRFGVQVTFRQLMEEVASPDLLATYLDSQMPSEVAPPQKSATSAPPPPLASPIVPAAVEPAVQQLIASQLQIMARQLELLGGCGTTLAASPVARPTDATTPPPAPAADGQAAPAKPFGAAARITLNPEGLTPRQQEKLADITLRYTAKTCGSKAKTQQDRQNLADPRVVSGFRPQTKEMVYPLVVDRSRGCKLTDIDCNEYIDLTCGFGSNFFGFSAPFVVDAVRAQLEQGIEIGPQCPLAGEVAAGICRLTKMDRAVFCNTGSEAVLGALRLARTATGRQRVAMFNGAYHGIVDEVIVRSGKKGRSLPAAAGIPPSAVENVLLLDYGSDEALQILESNASELAAVLVEPVQSRHPDLQPRAFLHAVRNITKKTGTALIFDEVITGFRLGMGGAQAYFDVRADLATYGKVIGGGLPIGVIAGSKQFMDGLDGGFWRFGDNSIPEAGVTYFAGTFVRHPLALAAAKAVLAHLERVGPRIYDELNARTASLVGRLNAWFQEVSAPLHLEHCGSLFKVAYTQEVPLPELLHTLLRLAGIHIWDARPCFLTTAHEQKDIDKVVLCFQHAVRELQEAGFYPQPAVSPGTAAAAMSSDLPPVAGARLGKDARGQPAWFAPDPERPGKYCKVGEVS